MQQTFAAIVFILLVAIVPTARGEGGNTVEKRPGGWRLAPNRGRTSSPARSLGNPLGKEPAAEARDDAGLDGTSIGHAHGGGRGGSHDDDDRGGDDD